MTFHLHLDSETIEHVRCGSPIYVEPTAVARDVVEIMREKGDGSVMVCRERRLTGIFTERDVLKMMATGASFDVKVSEVMTPQPVSISTQETVGTAIQRMAGGKYRHLPVVDAHGAPVGILTVAHILHYLVEHFPQVIYTLPPQPHHTTRNREGA